MTSVMVDLNSFCEKESLKLRWIGVKGYNDIVDTKITVKKVTSSNDITNSRTSLPVVVAKEETFLRNIYVSPAHKSSSKRLIPLTRMPSMQTTDSKMERSRKSKEYDSISMTSSIKQTIKKVLLRIRDSDDSTTIESSSFDSSFLEYHDISLINRNSQVVSTIEDDSLSMNSISSKRSTYMNRQLKSIVPDLTDKISAEALMSIFVKEYYLNVPLKSEYELKFKNMYDVVIKKDLHIYNMLKKNINMLPKDLGNVVRSEKRICSTVELNTLKDDVFDQDLFFYTSLSSNYTNFIEEMSRDIIDLTFFYCPLFKVTFDFVKPLDYLIEIEEECELKREINLLNYEIKANRESPGSLVRLKVMGFVCSSESNHPLSIMLAESCGHWLNNLLKCLFSPFSSVREESGLALAYIITRPVLTNELLKNKQFDVAYDMIVVLIRAIEHYPENLASFYCVIGYILHKTSSVDIIDHILDIGPNLTNEFLKKTWPKLLYYIIKYWPRSVLSERRSTLRKMMETLQKVILNKNAKKSATMTLCYLCRKFSLYPNLVTVYYNLDGGKPL